MQPERGRRQVSERSYTTEEAAIELNVPASVIAKWKHRQKVVPVGYVKGRGRDAPLYRLSELMPFAEEYHLTRREAATRRAEILRLASGR